MNISGIMEESKERSWFTIDERLKNRQTHLDMCNEELKSKLTDDDRHTFEKYKAEEEYEIYLINSKKEKLLESPTFLLLIANDINNKVFKTIPTYIEHADEAKSFSKETIEKLLVDNDIHLDLGRYIGIIVRKASMKSILRGKQPFSMITDKRFLSPLIERHIFGVSPHTPVF